MSTINGLAPILAGVIIAAAIWCARVLAGSRSRGRIRQLEQAAELLLVHNHLLERFLDAPGAPAELKRLAISFSDSMTNRQMVKKIAEWASKRPFDRAEEVEETEEVRSLQGLLSRMGRENPDLVEDFAVLIVTAVVGAALRWDDSATLIETAFPRLVATPQRDMAVVAAASIFKPALSLATRPMAPVPA